MAVGLLALKEEVNGAIGFPVHSRKTHGKTTMETTRDEGKKDISCSLYLLPLCLSSGTAQLHGYTTLGMASHR
jgi:hypothetical protein